LYYSGIKTIPYQRLSASLFGVLGTKQSTGFKLGSKTETTFMRYRDRGKAVTLETAAVAAFAGSGAVRCRFGFEFAYYSSMLRRMGFCDFPV